MHNNVFKTYTTHSVAPMFSDSAFSRKLATMI